MSSLPHLARLICAFGFGAIADIIRRKELISVTKIRKIFCIPCKFKIINPSFVSIDFKYYSMSTAHVIPGVLLIILAYFGREPYVCVAIITFSLGFNGAATVTNLANSQDLAPNYAGTLYGTINFVGTTPGIFSPMIVAYFTRDEVLLK